MHSQTRDRDCSGSTEKVNFSVKEEADGEHLQSISVVKGRYPNICATLDETASEAVATSFIMDMMSFFQASCWITKALVFVSSCGNGLNGSRKYGMQLNSPSQGIWSTKFQYR